MLFKNVWKRKLRKDIWTLYQYIRVTLLRPPQCASPHYRETLQEYVFLKSIMPHQRSRFFCKWLKVFAQESCRTLFFSFRIHLQWDEFVISWRSSCMVFIPNLFSFIQVLCPFIWIGLKSFFLRYQRTVQGLKIEGVGPRFTTFLIESQPEKKRQKTTQDNWRGCVFLSEGALANAKREV